MAFLTPIRPFGLLTINTRSNAPQVSTSRWRRHAWTGGHTRRGRESGQRHRTAGIDAARPPPKTNEIVEAAGPAALVRASVANRRAIAEVATSQAARESIHDCRATNGLSSGHLIGLRRSGSPRL
jgi:hypothetical protein